MKAGVSCLLSIVVAYALFTDPELSKVVDTEHDFSLRLPKNWIIIPKQVLDAASDAAARMAPQVPKQMYDYGFQLDESKDWFEYPYILISVDQGGRIPESKLESFQHGIDGGAKKAQELFPEFIQDLEIGGFVYDPNYHVLWGQSRSNVQGIGAVYSLNAILLTEYGVIDISGHSGADEFDHYAPIFEAIMKSVVLSDRIKYKSRATDSIPEVSDTNWGIILGIVIAGGIAVGSLVVIVVVKIKRTTSQKKPFRNQFLGLTAMIPGLVFCSLGGTLFLLRIARFIPASIALYLAVPILNLCGATLIIIGRKLRSTDADEVLRRDKRAPILYLRSFRKDEVDSIIPNPFLLWLTGRRDEERLAKVMNKIGPFVAIGKPGDKLPKLGAVRMYIGEGDWKNKVSELLNRAQLIVICVGVTGGLWWEMERVKELAAPTRLLLFLGADPQHRVGKEVYMQFKEHAERILDCVLPSDLDAAPFIGFDSHWNALLLKPDRSFSAKASHKPEHELISAMKPVLKQNRIEVPKLPMLFMPLRIFVYLVIVVIILSICVLLLLN